MYVLYFMTYEKRISKAHKNIVYIRICCNVYISTCSVIHQGNDINRKDFKGLERVKEMLNTKKKLYTEIQV
jgi:hypothetical protein